jgi:hypothetical protein
MPAKHPDRCLRRWWYDDKSFFGAVELAEAQLETELGELNSDP